MSRSSPSRGLVAAAALAVVIVLAAATGEAAGPRNPYAGFNLSGINWGSMQWERDQRQGRVVWPYYNVPAGGSRSTVVRSGGGYRRTVRSGPRRAAVRQPSW